MVTLMSNVVDNNSYLNHRLLSYAEHGPTLPVWLIAWRARGGEVVCDGALLWWERVLLWLAGASVCEREKRMVMGGDV